MLKEIFKNHKISIGLTYLVFLVEFLLFAFMPWLLGHSVDRLIAKDYNSFYWYIGLCTIGLGIGFFRRRLDTRVFIGIWIIYTTKAVLDMIDRKIEPAKIASRAAFIKHYSDFFEYTMPVLVSNSVNMVVSVAMIFLASWQAGLFALVASILGLGLSYRWACKIQDVEIATQETREEIHTAIINRDKPAIDTGYKVQLRRHIQRSDMEASVWSVIDFLAYSSDLVIIVMILIINPTGIPIKEMVGTIMATIQYNGRIWARVDGLSQIFTQVKNLEIADDLMKKED